MREKAKAAFEHGSLKTRTGFLAKVVVDLFMSVECGLKSLYCSRQAGKQPDELLAQIFRSGHNLKQLIKISASASLTKDEEQLLRELNNKGVRLRYDMDLFSLVESELLENDPVKFVIDEFYVKRLIAIATKVSNEAQDQYNNVFGSQKPKLMTKGEIQKWATRLRRLKKRTAKRWWHCCSRP